MKKEKILARVMQQEARTTTTAAAAAFPLAIR